VAPDDPERGARTKEANRPFTLLRVGFLDGFFVCEHRLTSQQALSSGFSIRSETSPILDMLMSTPTAPAIMNPRHLGGPSGPQNCRAVAVTFDDLPVISTRRDISYHREITNKLLKTITASKIPAIGFVNEDKLYREGKWYWRPRLDHQRVALVQRWLDAGLELGNHTFSHPDLHKTPLDSFKADVIRGEKVVNKLLRRKGLKLRYFRHPFLSTGTDLETRHNFEEFLTGRGCSMAPVTIDCSDWIFAAAYDKAVARGDDEMMGRITTIYPSCIEAKFDYFEKQSAALFGYEIKQVLLLHANGLNADLLGVLVQLMKQRGYSFISLDEALQDQAYFSPDTYIGERGVTWLHRWALTAGKPDAFFAGDPVTPEFVLKEAGVTF
jgi:peptidoglycan/xylan/chitin deacetylase (PgdA/CDA1 family)